MAWTSVTPPFTPAADIGPRPELAWLPVAQLVSDPTYQRSIDTLRSGRLIRSIAEDFAWHKLKAPTVAARSDGTYAIIDGQHTVEGARLHGGIPELPCLVIAAPEAKQQADGFVACNEQRIRVNEFAIFQARLVAKDPDALQIAAICQAANVTIPRYPIPADKMAPRQTLAVKAIDAAMRRHGDGPIVFALAVLADAHAETGGQLRAQMIRALVDLQVACRAGGIEIDRDRLVRVLGERMAEEWIEAARTDRRHNRRSTEDNIRAAIAAAYNRNLREDRRLPATP